MINTVWILPSTEENIEKKILSKRTLLEEGIIMIHPSMDTEEISGVNNFWLKGETLKEKLDDLEEFLENLAVKVKKIRIIAEENGNELTEAAIHFCLTHFPLKTEIKMKNELWRNSDIHGKSEEVYQLVHHLIYLNKYKIAEVLLKNYANDRDLFHLIHFGEELLNGNGKFVDPRNELFYFNLLQRILKEISNEKEEIQYVQGMKGLVNSKQQPFIYFLQNYCKQLYKTEEFVDFIVLYYRLAEELLLYAMGWDVDDGNHYSIRPNAKKSIPLEQPISRHFNSYLKIVLRKAKEQPGNQYYQHLVKDFTQDWLIDLIDLRHEGVGGHGFRHYSKRLFEAIVSGNPIEKMNELLEQYGLKTEQDLFELLQKAILALARKSLFEHSPVNQ